MYMSNQADANRSSIQNSNNTQRNQKMMNSGAKSTSKRGFSTELQYKLQLPEIMQQQQTKINQMKKQHEIRFSQKRPLQLANNQGGSMTQTRTKNFYDPGAAQNSQFNKQGAMGSTMMAAQGNMPAAQQKKNQYH